VAYFPESYGERVIALAIRILAGEKVPLTTYTNHVVLTTSNLDQYYPASS
jgi:ribose transport system substrate-binding protein